MLLYHNNKIVSSVFAKLVKNLLQQAQRQDCPPSISYAHFWSARQETDLLHDFSAFLKTNGFYWQKLRYWGQCI